MDNGEVVKIMHNSLMELNKRMDVQFDRLYDKLNERVIKDGEQDTLIAGALIRIEENGNSIERVSKRPKQIAAGIGGGMSAAIIAIYEIIKKLG